MILAAAASLGMACNGSNSGDDVADVTATDTGGTDTGSSADTGATDGGSSTDAAALCEMLPDHTAAPTITGVSAGTAIPAMSTLTGGTIPSGLYFETTWTCYTGGGNCASHMRQAALRIDANEMTAAVDEYQDGAPHSVFGARYTLSGTAFTQTLTCPASGAGMSGTVQISITPTGFTAYNYMNNDSVEFTRQ
jgi:hypothetical protein